MTRKQEGQALAAFSAIGDGAESRYIIRDATTALMQTGCFVLRPTKEKEAFIALKFFYSLLQKNDPRREELLGWLKRLDAFWCIGLEDIGA